MNFEFSNEQQHLREEARKFLEENSTSTEVRRVLDGPEPYHGELWRRVAELGWTGVCIPERYGGQELGYLELCVLAEELGRRLAPIPFASSVYLATEFLLAAGSEAQRERWLPRLADGSAIGTYASSRDGIRFRDDVLDGAECPVADGDVAAVAVVRAGEDLALLPLDGEGVERRPVASIDPTRSQAEIVLRGARAEPLGAPGEAARLEARVYDRAAVLFAFEQLGGARAALDMGRDYALGRYAFGRPIGSFQAIKHMLADMFVTQELARSNCYYGAWALSQDHPELPLAAATARVAAGQAYEQCAKNNIQVHGGMGFTWEFDCHLYYRRSKLLSLQLGSTAMWKNLLIDRLVAERRASA